MTADNFNRLQKRLTDILVNEYKKAHKNIWCRLYESDVQH